MTENCISLTDGISALSEDDVIGSSIQNNTLFHRLALSCPNFAGLARTHQLLEQKMKRSKNQEVIKSFKKVNAALKKRLKRFKNIETLKAINFIKVFYFSVTKDKIMLNDLLSSPMINLLSFQNQEKILLATLENPLSIKYPQPLSYKAFFLRTIIDNVEKNKEDASDKLLTLFTDLLSISSNSTTSTYCIYFLDAQKISHPIIIEEDQNFVNHGTTGLRTWEASKFMVEWCIVNKAIFNNRKILELGAGTGFLGISILKTCNPSAFVFTDKSSSVIAQLSRNIEINIVKNSVDQPNLPTGKTSNLSCNAPNVTKNFEVHIVDWNEIANMETELAADIIIGSDIAFDPSVFQALVKTLHVFLTQGASCAYIANTIRNEETDLHFRKGLDSMDLVYEIISKWSPSIFLYDKNVTYKLYKICLHE